MERGEFYSVLVGFRTGVAEKERIVVVAGGFSEFVCELLLQAVLYRVGVESEARNLIGDRFYIRRMCMTDGDRGMTAVKVEIFRAVGGVYVTSTSAHRFDGV